MIPFSEWLEHRILLEKKLTTKARNELPDSEFAEPGDRAYPIEDKAHARNALSRVSQFGSPEEKKKVRAKVHREFPNIGKKDRKKNHKQK